MIDNALQREQDRLGKLLQPLGVLIPDFSRPTAPGLATYPSRKFVQRTVAR